MSYLSANHANQALKKDVVLPFATDPKIFFFFLPFFKEKMFNEEKEYVFKHSKLRNISSQREKKKFKKKEKFFDQPTHVLAPKGQYNISFLGQRPLIKIFTSQMTNIHMFDLYVHNKH